MSQAHPLLVTSLSIGGFKSFGDLQTLELAPITLLFGPNSAGKSSILQALLLMKQTAEAPATFQAPLLSTGAWVQLGPYPEFAHDHDVDRPCLIGLEAPIRGQVKSDRIADTFGGSGAIKINPWLYEQAGWVWSFRWNAASGKVVLGDQWVFVGDRPLLRLTPSRSSDNCLMPRPVDAQHPLWTYWVEATSNARLEWSRITDERADDRDALLDDYFERMQSEPDAGGDEVWSTNQPRILGDDLADDGMLSNMHEDLVPRLYKELDQWYEYLRHYNVSTAQLEALATAWDVVPDKAHACLKAEWDDQGDPDTAPFFVNFRRAFVDTVEAGPGALREVVRTAGAFSILGQIFDIEKHPICPTPALAGPILEISHAMLDLLRDHVVYIGPHRQMLPHVVHPEMAGWTQGGSGGDPLASVVLADPSRLKSVNAMLEKLTVPYRLEVRTSQTDAAEGIQFLYLRDVRSAIATRPSGVGYGVGQVLPLVVESCRPDPSFIVVEQPELHLHPRLQAELGGALADGLRERGHQYLVETHSEHLVLRLQRLIRSRQLAPSDVAVYYVDQTQVADEEGRRDVVSRVRQLRLDEDGEFVDEWPDGFFEEAYREMFSDEAPR